MTDERDPVATSLIAALRRASFRAVAGGGTQSRSAARTWIDPDDIRRALHVVDHPGDYDPELRLAAWTVLNAFRGEYTEIDRVRGLAGAGASPDASGDIAGPD